MASYFYTAKSLKGEQKTGVLEAKDTRELAKILRQEGYVLITAVLEDRGVKKRGLSVSLSFLTRVRLKEKMFFTRNLRVMLASGIPLPRALNILVQQTKNAKFKKALEDIQEELIKGKNFSQALSLHSDIFSELFQSMIKVGEESGTLEDVLKVLTSQMERENELKSKIMGALIYPAVIIFAMTSIGILMLVMVIPKLAATFSELKIELPITTKFVIFLGMTLAQRGYLVILIFFLFVIFGRIILKRKFVKKFIDTVILKIPIISPLIKKTNSAYTIGTLSSLIKAGVPIVRSLEIVSGALGNIHYKEAIAQAAEKVRKGQKLHETLMPYPHLYPLIVLQMIEIGEETGETSNILGHLADFFEDEVANATKNISAVIEPVLMLLIGGAVGFFAISMIQPMYAMLQVLK